MLHWTEVLFNANDNKLKTNLLKKPFTIVTLILKVEREMRLFMYTIYTNQIYNLVK